MTSSSPIIRTFSKNPEKYLGWLILLLAFFQYANTIGNDYAWDDEIYILQNSRVKKGISGIPEIWQEHTRVRLEDFSGFRPVPLTTFAIEQSIWGMDPHLSHFLQIILFAIVCLMIFKFLRMIFPRSNIWILFLITLVFVVHPLHVEVVANLKSRDEILSFGFGLAALMSFIRAYNGKDWKWLLPSLLFQTLAILSKESGYIWLGSYPLLLLFVLEGEWKKKLVSMLILPAQVGVIFLTLLIFTGHGPGKFSEVKTEGYLEPPVLGNSFFAENSNSLWHRTGNASQLNFRYISKFFFPHPLLYYSGYNQMKFYDWNNRWLIAPFVAIIGFLIFSLYRLIKGRKDKITFGFLWYFLFIFLFLQAMFLIADSMADRFMFAASLGLCIVVGGIAEKLLKFRDNTSSDDEVGRTPSKEKSTGFLKRQSLAGKITLGILAIMIGGYSFKTFDRNKDWKTTLTLFEADMPRLENCAKAHFFLADQLNYHMLEKGRYDISFDRVAHHYKRSIEISPLSYYSYIDYGIFLMKYDKYQDARAIFLRAAQNFPKEEDPWFYLGKSEYILEEYDSAMVHLQKSMAINHNYAESVELFGRSLERSGEFKKAVQVLENGKLEFPGNIRMMDALADAYFFGGQPYEAADQLLEILEKRPGDAFWWKKVITIYNTIGDTVNASRHYQIALQQGVQFE